MDQYYSRVCGYKLSFEPWNDKFEQRTYLKYCNGAEAFSTLTTHSAAGCRTSW